MKKIKQILFKILFPHMGFAVLLVPISAILLIYSFTSRNVEDGVKYLSYFLSAYSLTIWCIRVPAFVRRIKTVRVENKYLSQYFGDAVLRVKLSLYSSLILNVVYSLMQFGLGLYNHSVWFYALAVYYFLLALMRFFLLREARKDRDKANLYMECWSYRFCGIILFFTNIALSVITFYMVRQNRGFSYHYIMTIAMAAHTFFTFTVATVNLIRYRKYNNLVISASKVINLAAAFVSMLSLETAMLAAFGEEDSPIFRKTMTACTGTVVCIVILSMSVYMIVRSTNQLHKIEKEARKNE